MLVLTRRVGDVVAIGDNIKVIVVSVSGKQVRLGIEADRSTTIHREEIYQKIKKEAALETEPVRLAMETPENITPLPEKKTVIIRKNQFKTSNVN
jgi:carbon storage regulator